VESDYGSGWNGVIHLGTVAPPSQTLIGQTAFSAAGNSIRMTNCRTYVILPTHHIPPMSESLQQRILQYLDTHGSLSDTRTLSIPGYTQATDADAQIAVLGALNSLLSREVSDQPSP
jgi:hypothetical protein